MNEKLWTEMLDVLKDISEYLEKQDSFQERAKLDKPPKIGEDQADEPIKGGESPGFGPGKGIAKQLSSLSESEEGSESSELAPESSTLLKDEDEEDVESLDDDDDEESLEDEEEDDEEEEKSSSTSSEDIEELKSLLKDIKAALIKSKVDLSKSVKEEIKKETQKMLRKMGFTPSRPDIIKLGIDDTVDIKKSEDSEESIKKVEKIINDLSSKSWQELGQLREKAGLFRPF